MSTSVWRKFRDHPFGTLKLIFFSLIMSGVTVALFLYSFELLFNYDLPYVNAISAVKSQNTINTLSEGKVVSDVGSRYEALGRDRTFTVMKIPRINSRIDLIKKIYSDNTWLYRENSGQYFFLSNKKGEDPNLLVVYTTRSWRSIVDPYDIQLGDNIFIQKDDRTNALFRVTERKVIPINDPYVPASSDSLGLVLIIEDHKQNVDYVFKANYIDVNNLENSNI